MTFISLPSAPSWGDFGDILQGAGQALGCSQLWKITGAVFGEHTRLKEMFGGIFGAGGGGYSALIKKEFLKWWLSQRGLLDFILIQAPKIVGCIAGGNGELQGGRRESQGAAAQLHLLGWHGCHIPSLINSSHHSYSPCSHSLLAPDSNKRNPNVLFCALEPCKSKLGLARASLCFSKCV